jgi:ectoine hydroxylase
MYDQYEGEGNWTGCLSPTDSEALDTSNAVELCGLAGSITIHNCRTVHSSPPSKRANGRPLLLHAYAAGNAFAHTPNPYPSCLLPPDWLGEYTSIYEAQTGEGAVPAAE